MYDLLAKHQQSAVMTKEKKATTTSFSQHLLLYAQIKWNALEFDLRTNSRGAVVTAPQPCPQAHLGFQHGSESAEPRKWM